MTASSRDNRINWIDWAKLLAITLIVPIHIPQEQGAQPVTYFEVFIVQVFFFYSGYLKKISVNMKKKLQEYWHALIVPYFIYNILFYPYWLTKFYMSQHSLPTISEALKPIIGIFFLQIETNISCGLNTVTYFLVVLLIMHFLFDICYQIKKGKWMMIGICIGGCFLYSLSKYNGFTKELVFVGLFKSILFYNMGVLCRQYRCFEKCDLKKDSFGFIISFVLSVMTFYYHANESDFTLHMISFWPTVLFGIIAFTYFCKLLDGVHSKMVINYSIGTMAILGLHWMIAGFIRYGILQPVFHIPSDYVYSSTQAYLLALAVALVLYPIIIIFHKKVPWMLGRKTGSATGA